MADLVAAALLWTPFIGLLWYYRRGIAEVPADHYEHQLPTGLTPAVVGALFGARRFAVDSAATTLDLVRRGVLRLERLPSPRAVETGDPLVHDHLLILDPARVDGLSDIERGLVDFLFNRVGHGSTTVSISEVRHWWNTHQSVAHDLEIRWERRATAAARYYQLVAPRAAGGASAGAYYGAILCVLSLFFISDAHALARLVIFPCGVAMVVLAVRLPSLTQRGIDLRRHYQAFRNYLHDFGRFHDKEAEQIVLWDYYLAYAVTLGLATESLWELFVVPPPVGEGTTSRALEAWLHLRPLPPVWSGDVPEQAVRAQHAAAEKLTALHRSETAADGAAMAGMAATAAAGGMTAATATVAATAPAAPSVVIAPPRHAARAMGTVLPRPPRPPGEAPPPSTYEANVQATTRAAARVGGCVGLLFAAPIVVIVLLVLTIGGCHALGKIT